MMSKRSLDKVGELIDALARVASRGSSGRLELARPGGTPEARLEFEKGRLAGSHGIPPAAADAPPARLLEDLSAWLLEAVSSSSPVLVEKEDAGAGRESSQRLTAADLVIALFRKIDDAGWLRTRALPDPDLILKTSSGCLAPPRSALGPEEGFLMSRLDGALSGREVVSLSPAGEPRTLQSLAALRAIGMVCASGEREDSPRQDSTLAELEAFLDTTSNDLPKAAPGYTPEQEAERRELISRSRSFANRDHYAILEVDRQAKEDQIRKAYYHLARLYHPDRFHRHHLEDMHRQLEEMFASITEAYNTLQDPKARAEYDASLARRSGARDRDSGQDRPALARDAYLRGRKHLDAGETFEALQLFESAVQNDPTRPEYLHYLARCQGQNPRWRKRAEENLLKAIEMNPAQTASYLELARLYKKGKLERRSLAMYEKVLEWDPDNREARKALQEAGEGSSGGPGFLGSIFKKD